MILSVIALGSVALAVTGIGTHFGRLARTTPDLLVASRAVPPWWNAAAISGEYISASSYLGIAGLTMKLGTVALWQPVGFGLGYMALLFFVAAPMRRSGSYTIPDLVEVRLRSARVRMLAAAIVVLVGAFYMTPQLKAAGLTIGIVTGAPYWVGVIVVAALVALLVGLGGMRGITSVQAFQYWVKLFALSVPAILLIIHLGGLPARASLFGNELPSAPPQGLEVRLKTPQPVTFPASVSYEIDGVRRRAAAGEEVVLPRGVLKLPPGAPVPVADEIKARDGQRWSHPVSNDGSTHPLLVYSLLLGTCLGTMGLPHILVRFYTNPDGPAARRTTVSVLGLIGLFYFTPFVYAMLGRALTPELYITGATDTVVLGLPQAVMPGLGGDLLAAVVAAGAFAAFTATACGLLVSLTGTLTYDVWGRIGFLTSRGPQDRRKRFRIVAPAATVFPALVALSVREADISVLVGSALGLAASTFCPFLLLGIWWRRLTARGAAVGMLAGATTATTAIVIGLAMDPAIDTAIGALLAQPAILSVPVAFATMVVVSLLDTPDPAGEAAMLSLHQPERRRRKPPSPPESSERLGEPALTR